MRPDDDERLPGCCPQSGLATLGRRELAGEQRGHELRGELGTQHPRDGAEVLRSEHLRRCDERGLAAALCHLQHGPQGHERLARPDLALDEAVHGPVALEIARDLVADGLLVRGELERKRRVEPLEERAGRAARGRQRPHERALLQQGDLQHEGLVHAQGGTGLLDLVLEVRPVDPLQRGAGVEKSMALAQALRERIGHRSEAVEHELHHLRELPARHRARGGIDRDRQVRVRLRCQARGLLIVEQLVVGVRELLRAAVLPDLAGEDAAAAGTRSFMRQT